MNLNKESKSFSLCSCAIFSLLAAVMQLFPIFFPIIGLMISPFSTLPICICTIKNRHLGMLSYPCAFLLISLFNIQEAIIFLFTTGPLGLALGYCFNNEMGRLKATFFTGTVLFMGITTMTHLIGISAFGDFLNSENYIFLLSIYLIFSLFWSFMWIAFIFKYVSLLILK